jgi:hypothetical protein
MILFLLPACAAHHVSVPPEVVTAVLAVQGDRPIETGGEGRLSGPGPGRCFAWSDEATGSGNWWVFVVHPGRGAYTCVLGAVKGPTIDLTEKPGSAPSTVYGEYRCGTTVHPIVPAEPMPDGGFAFQRYEAIPCDTPFPGPPLPFIWGANPHDDR